MAWAVKISTNAQKQLNKLDKHAAKCIYDYLVALEKLNNPRQKGAPLKANLGGFWRYRVRNYRIVCEIIDNRCVILVVQAGKRSDVYQNFAKK